jgi:hypothetical protein
MKNKLVTVKLTELIGKNVKGILAQVRNPEYLKDNGEKWRTIQSIRTYTERGVKWVSLQWQRVNQGMEYDCGFTGCTMRRNSCAIQLKEEDYKKLFQL